MWQAIRRPEEGILHRLHGGKNTIFPREKRFLFIREKSASPCTVLNIVINANMQVFMRKKQCASMETGFGENRSKQLYRFLCTVGKKREEGIIRQPYLHWRWEKKNSSGGKTHGKTNPEYHAAKELNDVERKINLKKAFQLVPNIVKYRKILIVDDIYTTGSTIDAVAEVLLQAGVVRFISYVSVSARDFRRNMLWM